MWIKAPLSCLRYWSAAARLTKKLPLRWTEITVSQSSGVIRWKIWSRSTPALLTTTSRPPKWSRAACTIFCAEPHSATESVLIAAAPPGPACHPFGLLGRACRAPFAGERGADVVDDHLGAGARHRDRDLPSDAAAG